MPSTLITLCLLLALSSLHITQSIDSGDDPSPTGSASGAAVIPNPIDSDFTDDTTNTPKSTEKDADDVAAGVAIPDQEGDDDEEAPNGRGGAEDEDSDDGFILDSETNEEDKDDVKNEDTEYEIAEYEGEEVTGGGVWSSIGMIAVFICGCICLERLYASCKKVYMKRTGRYGFSRLQNQTFNEFEEDDEEMEMKTRTGRNTKGSDQESV